MIWHVSAGKRASPNHEGDQFPGYSYEQEWKGLLWGGEEALKNDICG